MTLLDMIQTMLARRQALDEERAGITQELEAAYEAINRACGAVPAPAQRPPATGWRAAVLEDFGQRLIDDVQTDTTGSTPAPPATLAEAVERAPAVGPEPPTHTKDAVGYVIVPKPVVSRSVKADAAVAARRQRVLDYIIAKGGTRTLQAKDIAAALFLGLAYVYNDLQVLKRQGRVDATLDGWQAVGAPVQTPDLPPLRAKHLEAAPPPAPKPAPQPAPKPEPEPEPEHVKVSLPTVTSSGVCVVRRCSKCCRSFKQTHPADYYCKDCHEARKKERPPVRPKDPDLEPVWNGAKA